MTAARNNPAKRYIKTRSFSRLNGRAVSPGSERPERFYFRRRIFWIVLALALAIPGIWALVA